MAYFNQAFKDFFGGLTKNNTTEWFNENRKLYEKEVKAPFVAFTAEMISRIQKHEPEITIKPADAIMRINKDIRFSKDKTPYNTYVAANISVFGKKDKSYPGLYFQLSHDNMTVFGGAYMVESPALQSIRSYISSNMPEFKKTYSDKIFVQKFGSIQGEKNKRIPEELQEAAVIEPLIFNKQFYYSASIKPDNLLGENLPDELMEYYEAGKDLNNFLKKAIAT